MPHDRTTTRDRRRRAGSIAPYARGFSLIELVMVLVIVAVLGAVAAPRFAAAAAGNRARAAADRVAADLELARDRARATSASLTVYFDTNVEIYNFVHRASPVVVDLSRSPYESGIDSADFGGRNYITFNAFGVPDAAGAVRVSSGDRSYLVTVQAESGEVRVE